MSDSDSTQQWATPLSRRKFLRWTALVGVASVVGWRFLTPSQGSAPGPLTALSANQAKILAAAYATITLETDATKIAEAITFMDRLIGKLDDRTRFEFKALLALVEHSPILFHGMLGRFTALGAENRARCLEGWRFGAVWRRPVFGALKDLSYLYYYTRPEHWPAIGYTGPLVPRGLINPALERRYQGLEIGQ